MSLIDLKKKTRIVLEKRALPQPPRCRVGPVSYTHLDVYQSQGQDLLAPFPGPICTLYCGTPSGSRLAGSAYRRYRSIPHVRESP